MIDSFQIFNKADSIVKKVGTRDPLAIANELGIKIYYGDYKELLGMYTYLWKQRIVLLNNSLDDYWRHMVLAHEIGHDIYHRNLLKIVLRNLLFLKQ
ncbi:ImmA/IrrE family metallo-endopeptidase [Tissierella praeacuta]|uniref:ImmA/IrrE family metallo-endopeptidase n=1 Tax=Tissierella praeacuta TaxID=43131 RepID=UPI00334273EA